MKLKQTEYCHNCNQYGEFEFEDTTTRQVILCPHCRHEHWREIDMDTLIRIRTNINVPQGARILRTVKTSGIPKMISKDDTLNEPIILEQEERLIVDRDENGCAIIEEENPEGKRQAKISERRWGSDPRQG